MGRLWSSLVTALSIVCTFVFLLGGISPATKDLALYRVNVTLLADGLVKLSPNNTRGLADLRHPELPTYWYWGASGICDVTPKSATRCRRSFPATQNIVKVVEESLRNTLSSDQEDVIRDFVASWDVMVNSIPSELLVDKQATYAAKSKASVALAILSLVFSFVLLVVFLTLGDDDGYGPLIALSVAWGAGIILLFVGAALSILWALGLWTCGPSRPKESSNPRRVEQESSKPAPFRNDHELSSSERWNRGDDENDDRFKRLSKHGIGFLGENQVYEWLCRSVNDFSPNQWTSSLRERAGLPSFGENERDYSDFEYHDRLGLMRTALFAAGARGLPTRPGIKYHLEVKTTLGDLTTRFFISKFQRDLIDDYHADSNHVYIIIRIFHANSVRGPQQVFLVDPFVLLRDGTLEVVKEENGGIWVEVASESDYPRLAARL
ncbi:hypothetical protein B0T18DRAFT_392720 [Schizothecium vesticola]|uniref:Uncharacterized protein n=1 Tax=Schizothecium vesticola TaxID=314040 RepID=A0AA40ER93_9PEZI|nr:hypothetical protein B0T18DRAFT_392720 [Schizothecium vesticola]